MECVDRGVGGGGEERERWFEAIFFTVALNVNKVQEDVWAVSHLYNQNNRFRNGS